jgi:hypothetical protein
MALFNLTDISFTPPGNISKGPLSLLQNSEYQYTTLRYPEDVGSSDKAHYIAININEQVKTQFGSSQSSDKPFVIQNRIDNPALQPNTVGAGELLKSGLASDAGVNLQNIVNSGFTAARNGLNTVLGNGTTGKLVNSGIDAGVEYGSNVIQQALSLEFTRTIRRIKDTVVLYMPDTLNFQYQQSYSNPELGGGLAAGLFSAASSLNQTKKDNPNASKDELIQKYGQNLAPFFASAALNSLGNIGKTLFAAGSGTVVNPMMELLYTSPQFRTFRFDFQFYPRNEKEARSVQDIIDTLRFHQAPEIKEQSGGFFLIPPSEFDISFYYNGKENPNIPKISTCVLTAIDTDYAPNGFAAYEVPQQNPQRGGTGMPVSIRLGLQFQETEMVYKNSNLLPKKSVFGGSVSATQEMSAAYNAAGQVNAEGKGIY